MVRIRGRLEKIQKTVAQPIEIEDEPSEEEGELPKGNAEQLEAGTNQPGEGIEEENAQSMGSPLQDHPGEEELAAVLANMGEYGQASSPGGIPDGPAEEELPEEGHAEEAGEGNLPGNEAEDINSGQSVPRAPEDVPGEEEGVKLKAKPSAEAREIAKLKKKHQRMLGTIARLRQQIRMLKASLRIQKTARKRKRTTAARTPRVRVRFDGRNPIRRPTVEEQPAVPNDNEEQGAVPIETVVPSGPKERMDIPMEQQEAPVVGRPQQPFVRIKKETDSKEVQTEAPPSGVIRVRNSKQRNKKVQVKLPASTALWKKDLKTRTLHKMMKEAQQEAEQLREQTVPKERYEELQQQHRNISQSESQAFEGWQKEQEKVAKVTR